MYRNVGTEMSRYRNGQTETVQTETAQTGTAQIETTQTETARPNRPHRKLVYPFLAICASTKTQNKFSVSVVSLNSL